MADVKCVAWIICGRWRDDVECVFLPLMSKLSLVPARFSDLEII